MFGEHLPSRVCRDSNIWQQLLGSCCLVSLLCSERHLPIISTDWEETRGGSTAAQETEEPTWSKLSPQALVMLSLGKDSLLYWCCATTLSSQSHLSWSTQLTGTIQCDLDVQKLKLEVIGSKTKQFPDDHSFSPVPAFLVQGMN